MKNYEQVGMLVASDVISEAVQLGMVVRHERVHTMESEIKILRDSIADWLEKNMEAKQ